MTAVAAERVPESTTTPEEDPLPYPTANVLLATLADPIPPPYSSAWPRRVQPLPENDPEEVTCRQVILASLDGPGLILSMTYTRTQTVAWLVPDPIVDLAVEGADQRSALMLGPESAEILIREIAALLGFQVVRR